MTGGAELSMAAYVIGLLLAVIAVFLNRLLAKLDRLYEVVVVSTPDRPSLLERVARVEKHTGLADAPGVDDAIAERPLSADRRRRPR